MNIRNILPRGLWTLPFFVLSASMPALATASILPVNFVDLGYLSDEWDVSASYDDNTGQPYTEDPLLTSYQIASLDIWVNAEPLGLGVGAFDESDLDYGELVVDPEGGAVLLFSALDGAVLGDRDHLPTSPILPGVAGMGFVHLDTNPNWYWPYYAHVPPPTATIPEPATSFLIGLALVGFAFALRRS